METCLEAYLGTVRKYVKLEWRVSDNSSIFVRCCKKSLGRMEAQNICLRLWHVWVFALVVIFRYWSRYTKIGFRRKIRILLSFFFFFKLNTRTINSISFSNKVLLTDIRWLWLKTFEYNSFMWVIVHSSETECCSDEYALENGVGKHPSMMLQRCSLLWYCDTHYGELCPVSRTSCEQTSRMNMYFSSVISPCVAVGKLLRHS